MFLRLNTLGAYLKNNLGRGHLIPTWFCCSMVLLWLFPVFKFSNYCILKSLYSLHKKINFPLRISSLNVTKSAVSRDLVTFTEEILIGKLHVCTVTVVKNVVINLLS